MRIGIPAETRAGETRVTATPETVKKMRASNHQVLVQNTYLANALELYLIGRLEPEHNVNRPGS